MGSILLFTCNSILPVILIILLGYILKTKGFFTKEFLKIGNKTVFYVALPTLLFKNISDIDDLSEIRMDVIGYVMIAVIILVIFGFLSTFLISDPRQKGVIHQCVFRSNFALIGVPLAELLCGGEGVRMAAIISLFSIPLFNVMGVIVLSVYKDKKGNVKVSKIVKDILTNPLIIGILLGFAVAVIRILTKDTVVYTYASKLEFPGTIVTYISRSATPLSLLVLGGQFDLNRVSGFKKQLTIGLIGRNIIAPVVGVGLAAILTLNNVFDFGPDVFAALISLFATPVAVASAIMAEAMDNDGQLAGQLVVWTSLLSILTLFVVVFFTRALGLL